jgi:hypothetical protein
MIPWAAMFVLRFLLPGFIVLILGLQGYKWYRIYQLRSSNEPTPPDFAKINLLPWAALFLFFVVLIVWTLVEWLIHPR